MTDYIPFVTTPNDCSIAGKLYSDAAAIRVSLERIDQIRELLPSGPKRWLDPAIDGLHHKDIGKLSDKYRAHLHQFTGYAKIADAQFQQNPQKDTVKSFVFAALDRCNKEKPDWLSVPQLPLVNDTSRNKINKLLAETSKEWKQEKAFEGKLLLPAIFTHQGQLNNKTARNKKITWIVNCYSAASADGVWAVDSSLYDQEGANTFDHRFPSLRYLHEELNKALPEGVITVCGPYWGMNLVLWARGLVSYAGIGLGSTYKYNIPGAKLPQGNVRIALSPLRRWATVNADLKEWLNDAVSALPLGDSAATEFANLEKDFSKYLHDRILARTQVAGFYKSWFHKFSKLPMAGRALALFQDLSSSYVLGKGLQKFPLPEEEGTGRRPARVAKQFMMNCL